MNAVPDNDIDRRSQAMILDSQCWTIMESSMNRRCASHLTARSCSYATSCESILWNEGIDGIWRLHCDVMTPNQLLRIWLYDCITVTVLHHTGYLDAVLPDLPTTWVIRALEQFQGQGIRPKPGIVGLPGPPEDAKTVACLHWRVGGLGLIHGWFCQNGCWNLWNIQILCRQLGS